MKKIHLILGEINQGDFCITMSGIRWLHATGHYCRRGVPIAYCNILISKNGEPVNLNGENQDIQATLIMPIDGIIHIRDGTSYGGLIDQMPHCFIWNSQSIICEVDHDGQETLADSLEVQIIFTAGKRYMNAFENRTGILSGWFERTRAWTGDRGPIKNNLIVLGTCEILNSIRGREIVSLELLNLLSEPSQVTLFQDSVLIPTISMMIDQIKRTPEESKRLIDDFNEMIGNGSQIYEPEDYLFLGAILKSLVKNNLFSSSFTLNRSCIEANTLPTIVLTSVTAQPRRILRHRSLGYSIAFHDFKVTDMGPGTLKFLRENFIQISRKPSDIEIEFRELSRLLGNGVRLLVCNAPSNPLGNLIANYDLYDQINFSQITDVNRREMNVMLDKLSEDGVLEVIDLNLLAAQLGTLKNYPDGTHMSGLLERYFVNELARVILKKV